jgi:NAD(P)-dependent dehydrogenase (short-subunit alcohol dehydrogenase family)
MSAATDLVGEIEAMGRRALPLPMDVMDLGQAYAAIDRMIADWGRIDILVNNVGGGIDGPVEDFPEADFDFVLDLNVKSTFFVSQRVGRHMIARKSGAIINMGSQPAPSRSPARRSPPPRRPSAHDQMLRCQNGACTMCGQLRRPDLHSHRRTAAALADPSFRARQPDASPPCTASASEGGPGAVVFSLRTPPR